MATHRWTKASKAKLSATRKAMFAAKKEKLVTLKQAHPHDEANKYDVSESLQQQATVDIPRLEERAYRRGLLAALDCIVRELR